MQRFGRQGLASRQRDGRSRVACAIGKAERDPIAQQRQVDADSNVVHDIKRTAAGQCKRMGGDLCRINDNSLARHQAAESHTAATAAKLVALINRQARQAAEINIGRDRAQISRRSQSPALAVITHNDSACVDAACGSAADILAVGLKRPQRQRRATNHRSRRAAIRAVGKRNRNRIVDVEQADIGRYVIADIKHTASRTGERQGPGPAHLQGANGNRLPACQSAELDIVRAIGEARAGPVHRQPRQVGKIKVSGNCSQVQRCAQCAGLAVIHHNHGAGVGSAGGGAGNVLAIRLNRPQRQRRAGHLHGGCAAVLAVGKRDRNRVIDAQQADILRNVLLDVQRAAGNTVQQQFVVCDLIGGNRQRLAADQGAERQ